MKEKKQGLRVRSLRERESLRTSQLLAWSRLIEAAAVRLPAFLQSTSVALYSTIGNEVTTTEILEHALDQGKKVYYPKLANGEEFSFCQVRRREDLRAGPHGIPEPRGITALTEDDKQALVVFVPGLAFDLQGHRLGRGKGWYDRALNRLGDRPKRVALAYDFQVVERLPVEQWDERVDQIITEKRIIHCGDMVFRSGCDF